MSSAYCHNNLGLALLQQGQTERGVKELIRAVEIRPAPRYLVHLGDAYTLSLRDYRQAIIAYSMALEEERASFQAGYYAKLARAHILADNLEEASRTIRAGRNIDANDPALLVVDGFLQWKQGNLVGSRETLEKALNITGQTSNSAGFLSSYWGNAAEVGRLLSELRSLQTSNR